MFGDLNFGLGKPGMQFVERVSTLPGVVWCKRLEKDIGKGCRVRLVWAQQKRGKLLFR